MTATPVVRVESATSTHCHSHEELTSPKLSNEKCEPEKPSFFASVFNFNMFSQTADVVSDAEVFSPSPECETPGDTASSPSHNSSSSDSTIDNNENDENNAQTETNKNNNVQSKNDQLAKPEETLISRMFSFAAYTDEEPITTEVLSVTANNNSMQQNQQKVAPDQQEDFKGIKGARLVREHNIPVAEYGRHVWQDFLHKQEQDASGSSFYSNNDGTFTKIYTYDGAQDIAHQNIAQSMSQQGLTQQMSQRSLPQHTVQHNQMTQQDVTKQNMGNVHTRSVNNLIPHMTAELAPPVAHGCLIPQDLRPPIHQAAAGHQGNIPSPLQGSPFFHKAGLSQTPNTANNPNFVPFNAPVPGAQKTMSNFGQQPHPSQHFPYPSSMSSQEFFDMQQQQVANLQRTGSVPFFAAMPHKQY